MDRIGILRASFTFQFWSREWLSQELFIKTLLADFSKSSVLGFDQESEFQPFVDGCPNKVLLSDFPQCPIWHDLMYYLGSEEFCWPATILPVGNINGYRSLVSDVSCNETFLPLSALYTCTPSFRRSGIDSFAQVPTFQQKMNDLMVLIQVIENPQEPCVGCINGEVSKGHSFLAQLAREFRVSLSFTLRNSLFKGFLRRNFFIRLKCGIDTQKPPPSLLGNFLLQ